jgi:hypothetical protein
MSLRSDIIKNAKYGIKYINILLVIGDNLYASDINYQ